MMDCGCTSRSIRLSKALAIGNCQIAPGITDMAQFPDTHVHHKFNAGARTAWCQIFNVDSTDHKDILFLRMIMKATESSLPSADVALKGLFQTGSMACPSGVHSDLIGDLPHLKQQDVADSLRDIVSSDDPPSLWNVRCDETTHSHNKFDSLRYNRSSTFPMAF